MFSRNKQFLDDDLHLLIVHFSAHFTLTFSSIPRSLIPNNSTWNHFNKYLGCHFGQKIEGLDKIKQYFQHFGYIDSLSKNFTDEFDDVLFSALKTYQVNFNLNTTGELDPPTLQHMMKPRCGNPDIVNGTTSSELRQVSGGVPDNAYGFFAGDHGDGNPFDGPMKILAHAFSPPTGFFHLDGEENWVVDGGFEEECREYRRWILNRCYGSSPNNNGSGNAVYTPTQENDTSGSSIFGSLCPHWFSDLVTGFFLAFVL
ncbi:hypothetical protein HAX54_040293 [Datura stramonium]|uniref:Peptidase metallopeptidase domain-containing protein n=1 Tax=Datura stramonium TaxID=4076 RepID=A0ABS8VS21_DATST|nr:hypothetical protein [Datura stramonium]